MVYLNCSLGLNYQCTVNSILLKLKPTLLGLSVVSSGDTSGVSLVIEIVKKTEVMSVVGREQW